MDLKYLNIEYTQIDNVCATASYGIIIECLSSGKYPLNQFFNDYVDKHKLISKVEVEKIRKVGAKAIRALKEKETYTHFLNFCRSNGDKRGFKYIEEFHNSNQFDSSKFCDILKYKAQLTPIDKDEVMELREDLRNGGLAMVLYSLPEGSSHSVVIGFNPENNLYFKRDPNFKELSIEDFLATNNITEYILFHEK